MNDEEFDKLICSFVKLFAMYEYKIKDLTYWIANNENTTFKIDWDKFVNEKIFLNDQEKEDIKTLYITKHPPMKQVVKDNELQWKSVSPRDKSKIALFGHIRRVRNNLYHGGKFDDSWEHRERNRKLIFDAVNILNKYEHFLSE
jgi:hypothetical protein